MTGIVYAAVVESVALTFQAAGSLWRDCLVLEDIQTKSLWSQVTGECISGKLDGESLRLFPSALTTYDEFKKQYPHGKLLTKADKGPPRSPYDTYLSDESQLGTFGRVDNFERLKGKDVVFGLRLDGKQVAISQGHLLERRLVVLQQFSPPVVVTCDTAGNSVAAFSLPVSFSDSLDLVLTDNIIRLGGGRSTWNARTGELLSGEGSNLISRPITSAFWFAWVSFFPKTELLK